MAASAPAARRSRIVGVLLIAGAGVAGCGPVTSTQTLADATIALETAKAVEADRYAVYEYVSAVEYMKKAKEEEGFSDFQAAIDLAKQARDFAEKARQRALANPARGNFRPGETPLRKPDEGPRDEPGEDELPVAPAQPSGSHL
jgi:hypothetical protein